MEKTELRRELGFWDALALMVGITIGSAIFAVPGRVAGFFPSFWVIALFWVGSALFALTGSMIYAELGARLPYTGGEYVYMHRAFGPFPAFLYGWSQLLVVRTNPVAVLSLVFAEYTASVFPMPESWRLALATLLILLLGAANYFGLKSGKRVQAVMTTLKVGGMVAFVIATVLSLRVWWPNLASTHVPPQVHGPVGNTAIALLLIIFAYVGWDRVGYLAGEMRDPRRDLPRAMVLGSVICSLLYLSMNVCYHAALPMGTISGSRVPAADVARLLWGADTLVFLALLVMASTGGALNANIMASSRVYYTMARDGLFFKLLGRVHPRWHSPHIAILLHCGWGIVLLFASRTVETMVGSFVFVALLFWGGSTLALFKLRRQGGDAPFLVPGYPWLPVLYVSLIVALAVATCYYNPKPARANLALVLSGVPLYFIWRKKK